MHGVDCSMLCGAAEGLRTLHPHGLNAMQEASRRQLLAATRTVLTQYPFLWDSCLPGLSFSRESSPMAGHPGVRDASLLLGPTLVSISLVLTERVRGKTVRELQSS